MSVRHGRENGADVCIAWTGGQYLCLCGTDGRLVKVPVCRTDRQYQCLQY